MVICRTASASCSARVLSSAAAIAGCTRACCTAKAVARAPRSASAVRKLRGRSRPAMPAHASAWSSAHFTSVCPPHVICPSLRNHSHQAGCGRLPAEHRWHPDHTPLRPIDNRPWSAPRSRTASRDHLCVTTHDHQEQRVMPLSCMGPGAGHEPSAHPTSLILSNTLSLLQYFVPEPGTDRGHAEVQQGVL